jgi:hypothetical protein
MVHRWEWNSRKCSGMHHFRARILVSDRLNVTEHTPTHLACVSEKSSTPLKNISNRARYFPDRPRVTKVKTVRFPSKNTSLTPPGRKPLSPSPRAPKIRRFGQPGHFKMLPDGERIFRTTFEMFPDSQTNAGRRLKYFRTAKECSFIVRKYFKVSRLAKPAYSGRAEGRRQARCNSSSTQATGTISIFVPWVLSPRPTVRGHRHRGRRGARYGVGG